MDLFQQLKSQPLWYMFLLAIGSFLVLNSFFSILTRLYAKFRRTPTNLTRSTDSPSTSASVTLSDSPSKSASVNLSDSPSKSASVNLSDSPSKSASVNLSDSPSKSASVNLSDSPSKSASVNLSDSLSKSASVTLSDSPSKSASVNLSDSPSKSKSKSKSASVSFVTLSTAGTGFRDLVSALSRVPPHPLVPADLVSAGTGYEVFLSCGEVDTLPRFPDYLYNVLVRADIRTFRDENKLRVGEKISPELLKAIKESKISIPIFSQNYAYSKWALLELEQIVECHKNGGQKILPIFFEVDPFDVRNQRGSYKLAFNLHKKKFDDGTVQRWRDALKMVGELKGLELKNQVHGPQLPMKVVKKVLIELKNNYTQVPLVGMDNHIEELMGLLEVDSDDVRIVGIYGMGGLGKTTMAKVIYNQMFNNFDDQRFFDNVREKSKDEDGFAEMQKFISSVSDGRNRGKKLLLVLDDIDDYIQVDSLMGELTTFGSGSRIILTSRDKEVLDQIEVNCQSQDPVVVYKSYNPEFMNDTVSLQLFSMHAFQSDSPIEEFSALSKDIIEEFSALSKDIVSIAAGLPLTLVVLGSTFFGWKDRGYLWRRDIMQLFTRWRFGPRFGVPLRFSFEALDVTEKEIFLDIACLFIGHNKTRPIYMWESCKLYPNLGIDVLVSKSLITIDDEDRFQMHDQLRDLGRQIVHEDQSRIWHSKEALQVLEINQGTSYVKALRLWYNTVVAPHFLHLPNLRYLAMENVNVDGDFKNLLPKLRWLECKCMLDNSSLRNLNMKKLVVLELSHCYELRDDWDGWRQLKMANNLKVLDLSNCGNLETLPNLANLTKLVELKLSACSRLIEIQGLKKLEMLRVLDMYCCSSLRILPNMSSLKDLKVFHAEGCRRLSQIKGLSGLISLEYLVLDGCDSLKEGLRDLSNLSKLQVLTGAAGCLDFTIDFSNFKNLKQLKICESSRMEIQSLAGLEALEDLTISHCSSIVRLPNLSSLHRLKTLTIEKCEQLIEIPDLGELKSLVELKINGCSSVKALPDLSPLQKLIHLEVSYCEKLHEIRGIEELKCLKVLDIAGRKGLRHQPDLDLPNVNRDKDRESEENSESKEYTSDADTVMRHDLMKNIDARKKWVGMDSHVAKMEKLLNVHSNNVRGVVIHGIGGLGKTTIAKIIYDKLAQSFECCCFLDDVRVKSKDYNGLVNLQMQLISKTGNVQSTKIADAGEGIEKIKKAVYGKKILIVLDDVDEMRQFDMLTGKYNWYGAGSKIIVTTRNKDIVQMLELMYKRDGLLDVCRSYEPPLMNHALSLQLFSQHAFFDMLTGKYTPLNDYKTLSKKIVSSAGGLPLVLVTMGSLLAIEKDKHIWEEKLGKLDKIPHTEVFEKLRISYEGLSDEQQQIFLDIACFFSGEDKKYPSYMWNACGFNQRKAIETLVFRSMVKVGDDNSLWVHDHLRDLGRQIVREENSSDPWKRSRLWRHEEVLHLLVGCKGTEKVEALHLDFVRGEQESCSNRLVGKYFENLHNLRFLRMGSVDLDGDFKNLFLNLLWLKWAPLGNFAPTNCNLENLIVLDLSYSQITDDWKAWSQIKMATKLKVLNLSHCYSLTTTSHFSMLSTLEQLILSSCFGLVEVNPFFENLKNLKVLDLSNCLVLRGTLDCSKFSKLKSLDVSSTRLRDLPGLGELKSLRNLNTSGCRSLSSLSDLSNLKMLRKLDTSGCVALTEIQGLEELEYMELLDMSGCISLGRLPDFPIFGMLKEVNIAKCDKLLEVENLSYLESLVTLNMSWCTSLESIPNLSKLKHLKKLRIAGFKDLKEIMGLEEVKSLELLEIGGWKSIEKLPTMSNLTQLKEIYASRCVKLIDIRGLEELRSLEFLDISGCISIKNLPNLSKLKRLKVIKASGCLKLSEIQGLEELRSLALLDISGCKSLKNQPYPPNTRIEELY